MLLQAAQTKASKRATSKLTLRVVINPSVSPQVNNLSAETRNFKNSNCGLSGKLAHDFGGSKQ
jgi:hypothetical protein